MTRTHKILLCILAIILGWFLLGFGYGNTLGNPNISTISFLLGFALCLGGFIAIIIFANSGGKTYSQKLHILNFEKQSKGWNHNLYDLCLSNVKSIQYTKYDYKDFGSWQIELKIKRLIYNGKDSWLIVQNKIDKEWFDETIIKKEELNQSNLFLIINKI